MTTIRAFIARHSVVTYYALVFAISWGGVLIVVGPTRIPGTKERFDALFPLAILAMVAGPIVAGILMTGLVHGRAGFREFLTRLLRWRVGARWYAVALLSAPLLMTAVLLPLSLTSPVFVPAIFASDDKASVLLFGIAVGLAAGIFEELGWTGFATPELRRRYGVLSTGLIVGFLWGLWHFPLFFGSIRSSGGVSPALYLSVLLFSFLPAYRMLMVWVYDRTGSLLVAVLMHLPLAASQLILIPLALSGMPLVIYDIVFAAVLWVFVAAVAVANRGSSRDNRPGRWRLEWGLLFVRYSQIHHIRDDSRLRPC